MKTIDKLLFSAEVTTSGKTLDIVCNLTIFYSSELTILNQGLFNLKSKIFLKQLLLSMANQNKCVNFKHEAIY